MGLNSMKHYIVAAAVAATMAFGAEKADAASLDLMTVAPTLSSSAASIDYLVDGTFGELSTFGAVVVSTDGVAPNGDTEIEFIAGFALDDPTMDLTGGFEVLDVDGSFLSGELFAVGFTENVVELQFNNLSGSSSGSFGTSVLMEILFGFDVPQANPFSAFADGEFYEASITVSNIAPIPLPAGIVLLLTALGGLILVRRHTD